MGRVNSQPGADPAAAVMVGTGLKVCWLVRLARLIQQSKEVLELGSVEAGKAHRVQEVIQDSGDPGLMEVIHVQAEGKVGNSARECPWEGTGAPRAQEATPVSGDIGAGGRLGGHQAWWEKRQIGKQSGLTGATSDTQDRGRIKGDLHTERAAQTKAKRRAEG